MGSIFKLLFFVYVIVYLFLVRIATYPFWPFKFEPLGYEASFFESIFAPVMFVELQFTFIGIFLSLVHHPNYNIFLSFYLLVGLLFALSLRFLWIMIRERKFYSYKLLVVLFTISIFLPYGPSLQKELHTQLPHLSLSELIEREELGPFYIPFKHQNSGLGIAHHYQVKFEDDMFIIHNTAGKQFFIPVSRLDEENYLNQTYDDLVSKTDHDEFMHGPNFSFDEPFDYDFDRIVKLPDFLECRSWLPEQQGDYDFRNDESLPPEEFTRNLYEEESRCERLHMNNNDEPLFDKVFLSLDNMAFSDDYKWMVFVPRGLRRGRACLFS